MGASKPTGGMGNRPPLTSYRSPAEIMSRFNFELGDLKRSYNSTSMNSEEFKGFERRLIQQEVDRIAHSSQPLYNKLDALNRLHNGSSMTSSERDAAAKRIESSGYGRY